MWRLTRVVFRSPRFGPSSISESSAAAATGERSWTGMAVLLRDPSPFLHNARRASTSSREPVSTSSKASLLPSPAAAASISPPETDAAGASHSISSSSNVSRSSSSSSNGGEVFDVAIVGGGLIGAAAACALCTGRLTRDLRIALIDAVPLSQSPPATSSSSIGSVVATTAAAAAAAAGSPAAPDARVIAVNPSSIDLLKRVGVWDDIASDTIRAAPFQHMQVWDFAGPGFIRFNAADGDLPHLGYIVENKLIVSSLLRRIQEHPSISLIAPTKLQTIKWPKPYGPSANVTLDSVTPAPETISSSSSGSSSSVDGDGLAEIHFDSRPPIRARLVIGADGSRSRVRSLAHLRTIGWPYHQRGVIATVDLAAPSSTAWQRFLPSGPLALLPLGHSFGSMETQQQAHTNHATQESGTHQQGQGAAFSSVVWSTTEEQALNLQNMSPTDFAGAVNDAFQRDFSAAAAAAAGSFRGGLSLPSVLSASASAAAAAAVGSGGAAAAAALSAVSAAAAAAGKLVPSSVSSALSSLPPLESLLSQSPTSPSSRSGRADAFQLPPEVLSARSPILSFPLSLQHAGRYVAPRCVLIGDAAHTVHPLAGQGANLGFADVTALVTVLERLVEVGEDIGEVTLLQPYERERMGANVAMMAAMDSLKRVFAEGYPIASARSLGLSILNSSHVAKKRFASFASGTSL